MTSTALITGASSGIGEAFARRLARDGTRLVLVARREDRLRALADELEVAHGVQVYVLPADLADPGTPARLLRSIEDLGLEVDLLVNNAGYGLRESMYDMPIDELHDFLQVLLRSWVDLVHGVLPGMLSRGHGRIINVASVASYLSVTARSLYGPIKAFILQWSKTMHLDLASRGVNTTALCPGYTATEFFDVNGARDRVQRVPKMLWLKPEVVVDQALRAVERGRPVCIPGFLYRCICRFAPLLPPRLRTPPHRRAV